MTRRSKKKLKPSIVARIYDDTTDWCHGRWWQPRLLLLALMVLIFQQHLTDNQASDVFSGLNLGIHEIGHSLFAPLGEFMTVLGGSLLQCLVPVIAIPMFLRQRDYFAIAISFGWLSTNLFGVATYAADARRQELPLVSPGFAANSEEITHDWNWLLSHTHLLLYDQQIAQLLRLSATLCMLICLTWGSQLCWQMLRHSRSDKQAVESAD